MIHRLLDFFEALTYDKIPGSVIDQAKRCLLDWIGVTLGAKDHPAVTILRETVCELGGTPQASIIGTPIKTSMINAALVNGAASHVLDYDDTHLGALMHPSVAILPAIFALGESKPVKGRAFLLAYLTGFEIETRISMAMGASHYAAGWHSTATMGRFGAAAAACKLSGLNRKHTANALGLAGTQASGLRNTFGTMTKSFHPGKASADGLLSMLLAEKGFTSPEDILGGERGLGSVFSSDYTPERGLADLGKSFTIMGVSIKPFASCLYTHPIIDGILYLRNTHDLKPEAVKGIHCRVSKFCADAACQRDPRDELSGKFSTYYCAAVALVEGRAGQHEFGEAVLSRADIRDVMNRVSIEKDNHISEDEAEVRIELLDGRTLEHRVDYPLGDPRKPLGDEDVEKKFRDLTRPFLTDKNMDRIIAEVKDVDTAENLAELIRLCNDIA